MNANRRLPAPPKIALQLSLLLILLLAFAGRVHQLHNVPLNLDEIRSINRYVPLPLAQNFTTLDSNNHALASALGHLFSPQADNLFLLRWSVVWLGLIALPLTYRLGADLFGWRVGLAALFLLSFTPAHLGYSMILRGYIGLISLTVMSLLCLVRAMRGNRWPAWIGFALANTAVIHFHLFGLIATWTQVGLVGFWLIWSQAYLQTGQKEIRKKFGPVVIWLAAVHLPVLYLKTTSILNTEIWPSAFEVWRNGHLALVEELSPIFRTISYIAPMTPGGIGFYLYLFFFGLGLLYLWRQQKIWLAGALVWFAAPFAAIGLATQVSAAFYAYERFTFYLLPTFLIVVAVGMVSAATWLMRLAGRHDRPRQLAAQGLIGLGAIGLVGLFVLSTHWYWLTTTSIDWLRLAQTLSASRQPGDITICEEPHGFDVPDRAKAYCIWMLDFFLPELEEYTPKFQSSTDFVANYNYLQDHRAEMSAPGGVWLVLWRRSVFHPGGLTTDQKPAADPVVLPPGLAQHAAVWQFGRAVLVYVNSEPTLLDNLFKAVELLSQAETLSADRARYYRSLAAMEAFRGRRAQAQQYYDQSWAEVAALGGQYPDLFLLDTTPLLERIPPADPPPAHAAPVDYPLGASLCLSAYEVEPATLTAGQPLQLTLYWQTVAQVAADYAFFLQLIDETGQPHGRFDFEPFDRAYPTPWWWPGQRLVDRRQFVIPAEVPVKTYTVLFGFYDRLNPAEETVMPLFHLAAESGGWRAVAVEPTAGQHCPIAAEK